MSRSPMPCDSTANDPIEAPKPQPEALKLQSEHLVTLVPKPRESFRPKS